MGAATTAQLLAHNHGCRVRDFAAISSIAAALRVRPCSAAAADGLAAPQLLAKLGCFSMLSTSDLSVRWTETLRPSLRAAARRTSLCRRSTVT